MFGIGLLGGVMLCDFVIVVMVFGVNVEELCWVGVFGVVLLFFGVGLLFVVGVVVVMVFGYIDVVSLIIIGVGVVIYIVGLVIGVVLGVSFEVMVLSIVVGLVKVILVMVLMFFVVFYIGLNNLCMVVIFGGFMGIFSGVVGGFVVIDLKLVFYGCLIVVFYIVIGCLLGLLLLYFSVCGLVG